MNKQDYFKFGFIVLFLFLLLDIGFALSIFLLGNPLGFSWHPDFFNGILFSVALFGSAYLGWKKKDITKCSECGTDNSIILKRSIEMEKRRNE